MEVNWNSAESSNDLDWLAFCYVAGELDESQRVAFEAMLAEDQAARDAVVQAVNLSRSLAATHRVAAIQSAAPGSRYFGTVARWVICASLLGLVATGWWLNYVAGSDSVDSEVAIVWGESVSDIHAPIETSRDAESVGEFESETELADDEINEGWDVDASVDWMLVALDGGSQGEEGEYLE